MINCDVKDLEVHGYFSRNRAWLIPLFTALLLFGTLVIQEEFSLAQLSWLSSLSKVAAGVALLVAGIGTFMSGTLSARIIQTVSCLVALAMGVGYLISVLS